MGIRDAVLIAAILALSLWVLWRSLFRSKGRCPGCSVGGCSGPARQAPGGLVRLGGPPSSAGCGQGERAGAIHRV